MGQSNNADEYTVEHAIDYIGFGNSDGILSCHRSLVVMRRDGDDVVIFHRPRRGASGALRRQRASRLTVLYSSDGFRSAEFWDVRG